MLLLLALFLASIWSVASIDTPDEHIQAPRLWKREKQSRIASSENDAVKHVGRQREPRIVGGTLVRTDKYPYFVRIDNAKSGTRGICGGNLVAPDIVLTAGHCLKRRLKVVVNGYNRSKKKVKRQRGRQVQSSRLHPLYNGTTWENDFLLLKMKTKVDIAPIPLNFNSSTPETGDDLIAVGMGRQTEDGNLSFVIRDVTIPAADPQACFEAYQQIERRVVSRTMLCAGEVEKSPCKGDSGGPLLTTGVNKTLVGIISWGAGCGRKNFPTVFARTSGVQGWLTTNICEMSDFPPTWCPPTPAPTPAPPTPSSASALEASRKPTIQAKASPRPTEPPTKTGRLPTVSAVAKTSPRPTVRTSTSTVTALRAPSVRGVSTAPLTKLTLVPTASPVISEPTLLKEPTPNVVP